MYGRLCNVVSQPSNAKPLARTTPKTLVVLLNALLRLHDQTLNEPLLVRLRVPPVTRSLKDAPELLFQLKALKHSMRPRVDTPKRRPDEMLIAHVQVERCVDVPSQLPRFAIREA